MLYSFIRFMCFIKRWPVFPSVGRWLNSYITQPQNILEPASKIIIWKIYSFYIYFKDYFTLWKIYYKIKERSNFLKNSFRILSNYYFLKDFHSSLLGPAIFKFEQRRFNRQLSTVVSNVENSKVINSWNRPFLPLANCKKSFKMSAADDEVERLLQRTRAARERVNNRMAAIGKLKIWFEYPTFLFVK